MSGLFTEKVIRMTAVMFRGGADAVICARVEGLRAEGACVARAAVMLVVEDDPRVARAIVRLIKGHGSAAIVAGTCAEAHGLVSRAAEWRGVTIDVRLPDGNGLDVLEAIRRRAPALPALVLTALCEPDVASRAKSMDARFVVKPPIGGELTDFIEHAVGSRAGFACGLRDAAAHMAARCAFSPRQAEILYALAVDDRRQMAALDLGMSPGTLRTHLQPMLEKTGADDVRHLGAIVRAEALAADSAPRSVDPPDHIVDVRHDPVAVDPKHARSPCQPLETDRPGRERAR